MTQIKILIKTPVGYAKSTEVRLRPFLVGNSGKVNSIKTNAKDNKIMWVVDAKPNQFNKIIRNVSFYSHTVKSILSNKIVRKMANISDADAKELDNMLNNQTQISVVKEKEYSEVMKEFEN
jgi:hypothetical protein